MNDFRIVIREPTPDELRKANSDWYDHVGATFLDRWPADLMALSQETAFVEWPRELTEPFYDDGPVPDAAISISDEIDRLCDWSDKFIRLNSRSPKDASYPGTPITCAGRQAISWIRCSERCLDDLCRFRWIDPPAYICLRKLIYIPDDGEFRCFVKDDRLIAVVQYNHGVFASLQADTTLTECRKLIDRWFSDILLPRLHLSTVVVDISICGPEIVLIEINPYGMSDPRSLQDYEGVENFTGSIAVERAAA